MNMTDLDRAILAALDLPPRERDYRARELGLSPTAYAQRALALLEDPDVEAMHPQLVRRWRRIMRERRRSRGRP